MRIALAGYGVEGRSSLRYFEALGHEVSVYDNNPISDPPKNVNVTVGSDALSQINDVDMIVRSPSVSPQSLPVGIKIWSATNEFFEHCPAQIIGVTGTKGKGTTCTLIAEMLRAAGKTVHLVGNIGVPALDVLSEINKEDIIVFELSSFQLWDVQFSPHIAVVLMIEPDHQDIHVDMDEYIEAKGHIALYQGRKDTVIYHPTNIFSERIAGYSVGKRIKYLDSSGAFLSGVDKEEKIVVDGKDVCRVSEIAMLGRHNIENACAAITAARTYSADYEAFANVLRTFKGLEHHLEEVGTIDGVVYYNDSFSAAPMAAVAATKAVPNPKIMIYGGFDKKADMASIAEVAATENIKHAILIGQTKESIAQNMQSRGFSDFTISNASTMKDILTEARAHAESGDAIVLSPGCASFDMFANYKQRGEQFREAVGALHDQ